MYVQRFIVFVSKQRFALRSTMCNADYIVHVFVGVILYESET